MCTLPMQALSLYTFYLFLISSHVILQSFIQVLPVDLRLLSQSLRTFGHNLKHYLFVNEPRAHLRFFFKVCTIQIFSLLLLLCLSRLKSDEKWTPKTRTCELALTVVELSCRYVVTRTSPQQFSFSVFSFSLLADIQSSTSEMQLSSFAVATVISWGRQCTWI